MPDEPMPPDARDERVAELLAVEPLDEMTRRRLVHGALEQSTPRWSRFANVAAIAAAIAVGVGIGAVLVNAPDPPPATTASAPTEAAAPELNSTAAGDAFTAAAPISALGDLGDVSTDAELRKAVTTVFKRGAGADEELQAAAAGYPCVTSPPEQFGLVAVVAAGIGTSRKEAVTVVVGTSPAGDSMAVVLSQPPSCEVQRSVVLPRD
jgi:hypothetical protein